MPTTYLIRKYQLPAELEDEFSAALWLAGTSGFETKDVGDQLAISAWFEEGAEEIDERVAWEARGVRFVGEELAPTADWLATFRAQAQPFPVGERFYVDPREPEDAVEVAPEGRFLLRLPARTAFGIGSHESTALTVELLESWLLDRGGTSARGLDVGTGTGILCFVTGILGEELGARHPTVGFDIDPQAVFAARDNLLLNQGVLPRPWSRFFVGTEEALAREAGFDLIVVNVVPEEIRSALPALTRRVAPDGALLFSGILAEKGEGVCAELAALGFEVREIRRKNEWVAFRFEPTSP